MNKSCVSLAFHHVVRIVTLLGLGQKQSVHAISLTVFPIRYWYIVRKFDSYIWLKELCVFIEKIGLKGNK